MTNSEQALREFADGIMKSHETWGKPWNAEMREEGIEEIMEITTALISEHYYPKEKYDELLQQRDELKEALILAEGLIDMASDKEWAKIRAAIKNTETK